MSDRVSEASSPLGKTSDDIRHFGREVFMRYNRASIAYEGVAQSILRDLYGYFVDERGQPLFALMRSFRLCTYDQLPPESRTDQDATSPQWLALMGTVGQQAAWNDRLQSRGHRILPAGAFETPMLKAAFEQLNLTHRHTGTLVEAPRDMVTIRESISFTRYFYVAQALGNPNIVDQDTFVKPYGIKSVFGIGCLFTSKAFHMTLFFSKVPPAQREVDLLMQLSPFISSLLAIYDEQGRLWNRIQP
jgi:hypothetical protein